MTSSRRAYEQGVTDFVPSSLYTQKLTAGLQGECRLMSTGYMISVNIYMCLDSLMAEKLLMVTL